MYNIIFNKYEYIMFLKYFLELEDKDKSTKLLNTPNKITSEPEVVLRRTHSFETDEK